MTNRDEVIDFCQLIGDDPLLVQGSGGNVSWKDDDVLWVKASGKWLAHAGVEELFVSVDLLSLRHSLQAGDFSATPRCLGTTALRPSIETLLHALMPHRIVVHLHPVDLLSHLVCTDSRDRVARLMNKGFQWDYIEYCKPGAELAKATSHALRRTPNANLLILENHGIVLGGRHISEVVELLQGLLRSFTRVPRTHTGRLPEPSMRDFLEFSDYVPVSDRDIDWLVYDDRYYVYLRQAWALYPDHVVFLGSRAKCYNNFKEWAEETDNLKLEYDLIFIRDFHVLVKKDFGQAKQQLLRCYFDVLSRLDNHDRIRPLSSEHVASLIDWEAERYRQKVSI